jgi:hypothetical protein
VLEGWEAVDWAALGHAYGSAEDVPWLLRQVRSTDPKVRQETLHELFFTIVHQGTRYSATAPAVPFLVELATAPDTHDRARLVNLLAYAAVGYDEASLPDGIVTVDQLRHTTTTPGYQHEFGPWAVAAYQAVQAALPALLPLLDEDDDRLRREAAHLLAWFPSFTPASLPRLRGRVHHEPIRDTQATMIVAVGLLAGATGRTSEAPWLSELPAGPDPILRWAAATALARLAPEHPPDPAVQSCSAGSPIGPTPTPLRSTPTPTPFRPTTTFRLASTRSKTLARPGPARPGRPRTRRRGTAGQAARRRGLAGRAAAMAADGGRLRGRPAGATADVCRAQPAPAAHRGGAQSDAVDLAGSAGRAHPRRQPTVGLRATQHPAGPTKLRQRRATEVVRPVSTHQHPATLPPGNYPTAAKHRLSRRSPCGRPVLG